MKHKSRNKEIDILRFVFCFIIVNYHFFSHFLIYNDAPNYFTRGYIGDEFFFIISGFYFAKSACDSEIESPVTWNYRQLFNRLKKIFFPYYFTWICCFVGVHVTNHLLDIEDRSLIRDASNSVFELLFLEMFGFKKGLYCNDVSWFFSAVLISTFIIGPILAKYRKTFLLYIAPLISFISYGVLCLNFDYLYAPHQLIGNLYIMKGSIRALAAVCLGCFGYGIVSSKSFELIKEKTNVKTMMRIIGIICWGIVFTYLFYPFASRSAETEVQFDYIAVILMFIGLIPILGDVGYLFFAEEDGLVSVCSEKMGRYAFYAYFGQAIFYSFDKLVYLLHIRTLYKALILNISVAIIAGIIAFLSIKVKTRMNKLSANK